MDLEIFEKLLDLVLLASQKISKEDLQNAIDKAKSTHGDTSDLERVLSGGKKET